MMGRKKRHRGRQVHANGFTLIELMATLVILALIIAIAVPAIGKLTAKAKEDADKSSIALMERAGEMAHVDDLAFDPTSGTPKDKHHVVAEKESYTIPTLVDNGYLKLDEVSDFNKKENYVKKIGKSGEFVYMGKGSDGKPVESGDAPELAACAREGVDSINPYSSDVKEGGLYTVATTFDEKYVDRNVSYQAMTMNKDGDYVAAGLFGYDTYAYPRNGYAIDKYDKNMKLIDTKIMESGKTEVSGLFVNDDAYEFTDIIQNRKGDYVITKGQQLYVFNEDFTYVKTEKPSGLDLRIEHIVQANDGNYFVAGIWGGDLAVAKLDSNFELIGHVASPRHANANTDNSDYGMNIYDFRLLANGELLVAGFESYAQGKMFTVSNSLAITHTFTLPGNQPIVATGQLENGTIVAYTGKSGNNSRDDYAVLRTFDASLVQLKEVSVSLGYSDFNDVIHQAIHVDGNQFTTNVWGMFYGFDDQLNQVLSTTMGFSSYGRSNVKSMVDNGSYIVFQTDGKYPHGISKVNSFNASYTDIDGNYHSDDDFISINELAPRAIHTAPPYKRNIREVDGPPTGGNEPPAVDFSNAFVSEYNADTNRVNAVYAGSFIFLGDILSGPPEGYYLVGPNGELTTPPEEEVNKLDPSSLPMFMTVDNLKTLIFIDMMGAPSPPTGAIPVNPPAQDEPATEEPIGPKVDPCFAGAFMIQIEDMQLYSVQTNGSLKLLGNPATKDPADFGYDIWDDVLYYVYPNGRVVHFPAINYPQTQS